MKDKHEQLLDSFLASGKKEYILSTYTLLLSARWNLTLNRILFNLFVIPAREGALRFATRSPGESVSTLPFFELRNLTENSVLHQQLKARLTFWRGWGTSDAMPPYISRESPLLSPASHSEILDPRSAPWEFCIFFNLFATVCPTMQWESYSYPRTVISFSVGRNSLVVGDDHLKMLRKENRTITKER